MHACLDQGLVDSELVQCEGASLVATQNIHACHFLDGCHPLSDGTLLG